MDRVQILDLLPKYTSCMERNKSCVYILQRGKFLSWCKRQRRSYFTSVLCWVFIIFFFPQEEIAWLHFVWKLCWILRQQHHRSWSAQRQLCGAWGIFCCQQLQRNEVVFGRLRVVMCSAVEKALLVETTASFHRVKSVICVSSQSHHKH